MRRYDNMDEMVNAIKEKWNKNLKTTRIWGFVAAVLMIVMGILCIAFPVQTTLFVEIFVSIALLVFGIWEIVQYVERPVFFRSGVSLASGILNVLLAVLLLTSPTEDLLISFGFLFGLDLLMLGFEMVTATSRLQIFGIEGTGWLTADGIMNIIVGIILLIMPMASIAAVSAILAVYLIFGGISLLVMSINAKELKA